MDATPETAKQIHRVKRGRPANTPLKADDLPGVDPIAAVYAVRVWNGQSPDLPIAERIERVLAALKGQNLLTTGLSFPPIEIVQ